jgi:hypothetical protein
MPKYYLQVEALNFSQFVYDTYDISTIRGGSFVLLDAIRKLEEELLIQQIHPITVAASLGLFSFENDQDEERVRQTLIPEVLAFLDEQTGGHATFQAAVQAEIPGNFRLVLQRLQAEIRRKQLRAPTVRIPQFTETDQEDYLDGWRPGVRPYLGDPNVDSAKISEATYFRRQQGRKIKHRIFSNLLEAELSDEELVAKDLGLLAQDQKKGILNGKIAIIHLDGNSFGKIRHEHCTTPETRTRFDRTIQDHIRIPFLQALLERARQDPDFLITNEKGQTTLRLEVLLWGGDELTLIVPAWKGLETLTLFYEQARGKTFGNHLLTHRGALIFCHHNAPILLMRTLADSLLARTKLEIQDNPDGEKDAAHYLVLESFDTIRGSLDEFICDYYADQNGADNENGEAKPSEGVYKHLLLYGHELTSLRETLKVIQAYAPKRKVFEIISALRSGETSVLADLKEQIAGSVDPRRVGALTNAMESLTAHNMNRWYLVADLWDFIREWN